MTGNIKGMTTQELLEEIRTDEARNATLREAAQEAEKKEPEWLLADHLHRITCKESHEGGMFGCNYYDKSTWSQETRYKYRARAAKMLAVTDLSTAREVLDAALGY